MIMSLYVIILIKNMVIMFLSWWYSDIVMMISWYWIRLWLTVGGISNWHGHSIGGFWRMFLLHFAISSCVVESRCRWITKWNSFTQEASKRRCDGKFEYKQLCSADLANLVTMTANSMTSVSMTKMSSTSPMLLLISTLLLLPHTMTGFASAEPISTVLPSEVGEMFMMVLRQWRWSWWFQRSKLRSNI